MLDWLKKHITAISLTGVFLVGLGLLAYPTVSDYWNSFHQSEAIMDYAKSVSDMDSEAYDEILASAEAYNAQNKMNWNFSEEDRKQYEKELNFNDSGIMGYINIPKIDIKLSIFHGTDESVLQTSIGHLEGTSLPIGGTGTHSVLSGHRGLPSARLFSDLDKLREGDVFTLHILDETLTYEVDQIRVVEPTDLSQLQIDPDKDYCTLVTCTPYGINTHRLLVRGHRIDNLDGNANVIADAVQIKPIFIAPFLAVPILLILLAYILLVTSRPYQERYKKRKQDYLRQHGLQPVPNTNKKNDYQKVLDKLKAYSKHD
ncbi:class C sortase [Streptococcus chenjunshii]|uniref:Class C sortase n=1 Tax=Streptococcus chenjunshii TaxID=2173853 RepID=A0A372KNL5_9STRE|nr:class C sortase [Streptococcus chenjunshii]RFU51778.1 class C sortase [Streptococcus chenjunshii]RFU53867.1 class C sortase [Streptococcus chenjunshii]